MEVHELTEANEPGETDSSVTAEDETTSLPLAALAYDLEYREALEVDTAPGESFDEV